MNLKHYLHLNREEMMKRCLTIAALMIIPIFALSKATEELVKSMVPHGQISQKIGQDFFVKTKAGTKVTIEFDRTGILDEASGLNLGKGDIFEPGNGLLALESVAKALQHKGHHILGEWRLEKDSKQGWVYELAGLKEEETVNYIVNAKSSKLIGIED
jgi:hypothetical protein